MRELLLGILLLTAGALVVRGAALIWEPAAWIVAGVLLAVLAVLFLTEVGSS